MSKLVQEKEKKQKKKRKKNPNYLKSQNFGSSEKCLSYNLFEVQSLKSLFLFKASS